MLVGRVFQGMGAGGVVALCEIVVTDLVELRLRGKWFGYLTVMWAVGSISGPVIGGAFARKGEPALFVQRYVKHHILTAAVILHKIYGDGYSGSIFHSALLQSQWLQSP
jgi:MFS family permease